MDVSGGFLHEQFCSVLNYLRTLNFEVLSSHEDVLLTDVYFPDLLHRIWLHFGSELPLLSDLLYS